MTYTNDKKLSIYLARLISGYSYDDVSKWFADTRNSLLKFGYKTYSPMTGKGELRTETKFRAEGYGTPVSSNHAIFERDQWMVHTADMVLMDLTGAKSPSIGCMMELAWAAAAKKHSIVVMESTNPHRHAFVLEAADIIFETLPEAIEYLQSLISGSVEGKE